MMYITTLMQALKQLIPRGQVRERERETCVDLLNWTLLKIYIGDCYTNKNRHGLFSHFRAGPSW